MQTLAEMLFPNGKTLSEVIDTSCVRISRNATLRGDGPLTHKGPGPLPALQRAWDARRLAQMPATDPTNVTGSGSE